MILDSEVLLAKKIATTTAKKWRHVEREDLASELVLWLFEHEDQVVRYRDEEAEGKLFVALRREAAKRCARETRERTGEPLDYHAKYSFDQIKRALPYVFEDTPVTVVPTHPGTGAPIGDVQPGGEALVVMTDIKNAYRDQPAEVRLVLALRFRDGLTEHQIATMLGASQPTISRRIQRAIDRIRVSLGD